VLETINSLYLVFEYVEGQTLETRLDIDGYLDLDQVRDIFSYVCKGLIYAHHNNVVHCDLKPGNIMISDSGTAKIMDFGVARKAVGEEKRDLRTVAGTPAYMPPEQQKGITSKQSDIYSLAVCLYESLVGSIPWSVSGFDVVSKKIIPPSAISKSVPKIIDQLIIMSLNEDPAKRIQTVEEFWDILKNA
jgi:serine/threonine-protein kinase